MTKKKINILPIIIGIIVVIIVIVIVIIVSRMITNWIKSYTLEHKGKTYKIKPGFNKNL